MNKLLTIIVLFALYVITLSDEKPKRDNQTYQLTENDIQDIRWLKDTLMKRIQKEEQDELAKKLKIIKTLTFFLTPICLILVTLVTCRLVYHVFVIVRESIQKYKITKELKMIKNEVSLLGSISVQSNSTISSIVASEKSTILCENKKALHSNSTKSETLGEFTDSEERIYKLENELSKKKKKIRDVFCTVLSLIFFWIVSTGALLMGLTGVASYIDVIVNQDKNCTLTKMFPSLIKTDCFDIYGQA